MTKICFVDTETTGLGDECDIWEIGIIVREPGKEDVEHECQLVPRMDTAEPTGLRIGRYYERVYGALAGEPPEYGMVSRGFRPTQIGEARQDHEIAAATARLLDGATFVGAVPDFDARHLARWLRRNNQCGTWHYHLVDVETLAAGALRVPPPWTLEGLLAKFGLAYDEKDRHTALGDARMVRDLYDAVLVTDRGTGEPGRNEGGE